MKLIITVTDEISDAIAHNKHDSEKSRRLLETLSKNSVSLKPLYSNSNDSELQKYFIIDTSANESVSNLIDELWQSGAITSAYTKPKDEPPK